MVKLFHIEVAMLSFDQSLPMLLNRTLDAVMPAYREIFARFGVTDQQWRVLRVIWSSRNVTSRQLSDRTLLSPSSLVAIIDRLEKKGLVTRVRSVEDRRAAYVVATAKGRALQEEVTPLIVEIHDRIRTCLSEKEWSAMETALEKIGSAMAGEPQRKRAAAR